MSKIQQRVLISLSLLTLLGIIFLYLVEATKGIADVHAKQARDELRIRVLAHSDTAYDQQVKRAVRDRVLAELYTVSDEWTSNEQMRTVIMHKIDQIEAVVAEHLRAIDAQQSFKITFGKAEFPEKTDASTVYPAGQYEALVVTLGDGAGQNWWCLLFSDICPFNKQTNDNEGATQPASEKTAEQTTATQKEKIAIRFWLWEWLQARF